MAWMNAETLRLTLDEGRMVYWSRSRQEVWRKGDTSGDRQFVREAYYDCDGDVLLFLVEQEGKGACHTGDVLVLLPALRRRRLIGRQRERAPHPTARDEFRAAGGRAHRRAGVDRAARRPRDAGRRVRQARRRRHRASCSSRSSTASAGAASRSSAATRRRRSMLRDGSDRRRRRRSPPACPLDQGMLAALEALLVATGRRASPTCRRCRAA